MKLQINTKGAWADVSEFKAADLPLVRFACGMLLHTMSGIKLAIVADDGVRYFLSMHRRDPVWRTAQGEEMPERAT